MKVAVVGCAHGELDTIYAALAEVERAKNVTVDLVICAGDFQAVRNSADLACMACPPKFRDMRSFWRYYSGAAVAPVPTLFVGGNHEASNHLQEIPLGGLVAPNMYFLGNAGVVWYRGLRVAGVSGVYTSHNYEKQRVERPPYPRNQIKSVYHMRKEDVDRLMRVKRPVDIFISHDWPRGIWNHGSLPNLLSAKPFLKSEITNNSFGNPAAADLLNHLQPAHWFSAHIHLKFPALVKHPDSGKETRFLALDKALPRRDFIQILDIPVSSSPEFKANSFMPEAPSAEGKPNEFPILLDPEWLTILQSDSKEPGRETPVSDEEINHAVEALRTKTVKSFVMPVSHFEKTASVFNPSQRHSPAPTQLSLQASNLNLMNALEIPPESWIAPEPPTEPSHEDPAAFLGLGTFPVDAGLPPG